MATLSGSEAVMKALEDIAKKMGSGAVSVGFMGGTTYPDGELVAGVAFQNEFGVAVKRQPPRPFFRRMIAKESPSWVGKMSRLAKSTNYDGNRVLGLMGEDIKGALQESINDFTTPPLAASTVEAKGFSKPLIDTSHMINSITYDVE